MYESYLACRIRTTKSIILSESVEGLTIKTYNLPAESKASPTGLKQPFGQLFRSPCMMKLYPSPAFDAEDGSSPDHGMLLVDMRSS